MGKICCCRAGEGNMMVELTAGGGGGKPGTDNRWQLSSSTQCWSSSWSDTTYFWIQSQFFFQICWVLFRMLVRSSTHLLIIRQASSMFDNLQELTKVYLRSIMVCSVLLNCCQLRLDPCEKDSPSCILQLPGDSLCSVQVLLVKQAKDEKPDQIPKPTSKRAGLARPEKVLGRPWNRFGCCGQAGLETAGNSSAAWTPTILFLYKWQQYIKISYTYFEASWALNKQSSFFSL